MTFGSFNHLFKVTPRVIDAWLTILQRVPDSRLLVLAYRGGYVEKQLHALAGERGIAASRIELCDQRPPFEYLRLQQRADIALDPFPFNGHTTTCDSIWMGVPVVMLQGDTYASRFGGSVLANVGLESCWRVRSRGTSTSRYRWPTTARSWPGGAGSWRPHGRLAAARLRRLHAQPGRRLPPDVAPWCSSSTVSRG